MIDFLSGLVTMGYIVAGGFFLRFWAKTRDRLFAAFAVAFWLLAAAQAMLALSAIALDERAPIYGIRLAAFVLIVVAIVGKNRRR